MITPAHFSQLFSNPWPVEESSDSRQQVQRKQKAIGNAWKEMIQKCGPLAADEHAD